MPSPHAEIRRRFAEINYPAQSYGLPCIFSCDIAEPREGVGKTTKRSTSPGTAVVTGLRRTPKNLPYTDRAHLPKNPDHLDK
jgi:hypothetical protein